MLHLNKEVFDIDYCIVKCTLYVYLFLLCVMHRLSWLLKPSMKQLTILNST